MRERILITGPGGRVGPQIVPLLREHFALRLFDAKPLKADCDDEVVRGDIQDFEKLREACKGVQTLIHLAAISDEDDFHSRLLPVNLAGLYNAFEAAKQAGMKRDLHEHGTDGAELSKGALDHAGDAGASLDGVRVHKAVRRSAGALLLGHSPHVDDLHSAMLFSAV